MHYFSLGTYASHKVKQPAQVWTVSNGLNRFRASSVSHCSLVMVGQISQGILRNAWAHSSACLAVDHVSYLCILCSFLEFTELECEPYGPLMSLLMCVFVYSPAPLVDLTPTHSGSAMLMLLSVVFVGLAVFVIYKFKRCVFLLLPPTPHPHLPPLSDRFRSNESQ